MGTTIEKAIGFKTEGQLQFFNKKAYNWSKLYSIIEFCNEHEDDLVILADNLVERMTKGVELPNNLELVLPSDTTLTIEDLKLIDGLSLVNSIWKVTIKGKEDLKPVQKN